MKHIFKTFLLLLIPVFAQCQHGILLRGNDASPISTDGLALWFRGDNVDTTGTTLTTWYDQSGNGNDLGLITGDPQIDTLGGQSAITFDGNDGARRVQASGFTWPDIDTHIYVFVVFRLNGLPDVNDRIYAINSSTIGANGAYQITRFTSTSEVESLSWRSSTNGVDRINGIDTSQNYILMTETLPLTQDTYINDISNGANDVTAPSGQLTSVADFAITIAMSRNATQAMTGTVAEMIVYFKELTNDEVDAVYTYLSERYSIN